MQRGVTVMAMKSIKKMGSTKGISIVETPIPVMEADDVLVKVKLAGICGTDLHIYKWDEWSRKRIKPPIIIGHEFLGNIVDLGSNVKHFKKGQRVSAEGHITCGQCFYCKTGKGHICENVEIIGVDRDGCFAEFIRIPGSNIWPIHEDIPDRYGAIFDPLGNAMHTVMAQLISMKDVLITGTGSIGLFAIAIAKANGAKTVIVSEPNLHKRTLATKVGADHVLNSSDEKIEQIIMDITKGKGPDVFLEMSGNPKALHMGLRLLRKGGTASLLGIPETEISIDIAEEIIFKGISIHGINGRHIFETWYQCQDFLLKYGKSIDPIITDIISFDRVESGFSLMEKNKAAKVLLEL